MNITRATVSIIGLAVVLAAGSSWWGANPVQAAPQASTGGGSAPTCSISYNLPGDIGANPNQATLDAYSWQIFLALNAPTVGSSVSTTGDNSTLWGASSSSPITPANPGWSSTDDLLEQVTQTSAPAFGSHYYPLECQKVKNYKSYRVVNELNKVADNIFEATVKNLSGSPAIATNGKFLRYEILISPITFNTVVSNKWYLQSVLNSLTVPLSFPCGIQSAGGPTASPATTGIGPFTVKNAWMDATGISAGRYHTENLLVYTRGAQNSTGKNTCEVKKMALVGMHVAHKTTTQTGWTWSTFEHKSNAPDCTSPPAPAPQSGGAPTNTSCPPAAAQKYNLAPNSHSTASKFQTCNTPPTGNAGTTFYANQPPNPTAGYSHLCRQVPLSSGYPAAYAQSQACNAATGAKSVWSNYVLVSTQWFTNFPAGTSCQNSASLLTPGNATIRAGYAPQATMNNGATFPFLANTTMESYERSVCMGCHQQALTINTSGGSNTVSTDLMYFLQLEVPAAPVNQVAGKTFKPTPAAKSHRTKK
jgi:hypothetical protein